MNPEKASTLKLLRAGMGNSVRLLETRKSDFTIELRAHLPGPRPAQVPVLFLISSLAFLEARPFRGDQGSEDFEDSENSVFSETQPPTLLIAGTRLSGSSLSTPSLGSPEILTDGAAEMPPEWLICDPQEYIETDGWTPADFLEHLKFDDGQLRISLGCIRGRAVFTEISLDPQGQLKIRTIGRGHSADRWLSFVRGRSHMQPV